MRLTHGLYCEDSRKVYNYWARYRPDLAQSVNIQSKKYIDALTQSQRKYYKSNILRLCVLETGLMIITGEVLRKNFRRLNEERICDEFYRIIWKKEDEVRNIMISLGFISEPKKETEDINKGKEGKK